MSVCSFRQKCALVCCEWMEGCGTLWLSDVEVVRPVSFVDECLIIVPFPHLVRRGRGWRGSTDYFQAADFAPKTASRPRVGRHRTCGLCHLRRKGQFFQHLCYFYYSFPYGIFLSLHWPPWYFPSFAHSQSLERLIKQKLTGTIETMVPFIDI